MKWNSADGDCHLRGHDHCHGDGDGDRRGHGSDGDDLLIVTPIHFMQTKAIEILFDEDNRKKLAAEAAGGVCRTVFCFALSLMYDET